MLKISSVVLLSLLGLLILIAILININAVQNFLVKKVAAHFSDNLHTNVSIRHVDFQFFNKVLIEDALVEDQHQDTLLFAGRISLRITDLLSLKKHPVLHYVGLSNARVNLKRTVLQSAWNYQFILDAFASPASSSPGKTIALDIRTVDLHNVQLNKTDAWGGQDMQVAVKALSFRARKTDFRKHNLQINSILVDQPEFHLRNYAASALRPPDSSKEAADTLVAKDTLRWNPDNWSMQVKKITLRNGIFTLDNPDPPITGPYFDAQHIHVDSINADFEDMHVVKDSLMAGLVLSAREHSGIEIRSLKSQFKISPVIMEFAQLDLQTNRSHIKDYYAMQFSDISDMDNYISKVRMVADFRNSEVSSDDIAFFAPALSHWKMQIAVSGKAAGTVSNLSAQDMNIDAGDITHLKGQIQLNGLPNIDETFIDFKADQLTTNSRDLQRLFPDIKDVVPGGLSALNLVNFKGSFTGFINDFVAYGDFNTNLGYLHSDINMKTGQYHRVPVYSGNLSGKALNIGALFDIDYLGAATFDAAVKGRGFALNDLRATLKADINTLTVNDYAYQHIQTNGEFNGKLFSGRLEMQDPNASLNFNGTINLNDTVPQFDFRAEVLNSDLRALNITGDSIVFSGDFELHFAGNNIDNFLGDARLYNINLFKNQARVAFDSLNLHSTLDSGNQKLITLKGNEIDGYLKGRYNIHELPAAFQLFLNRYYPSHVQKPDREVPDEDFTFVFNFGHVSQFLKAFTTHFGGLDNASVSGSVNIKQDRLTLDAAIPSFSYDQYRAQNIRLNGNGTLNKLSLQTQTEGVYISDSLWFPKVLITGNSSLDTSYITLQTSIPGAMSSADINGRIITLQNGYKISIPNAAILINDKEWKVSPGNEIFLNKGAVKVSNFNISQNDQHISLTSDGTDSSENAFLVNLQHLNLNDFAQLLHTSSRIEGIASGVVHISGPANELQVRADVTTNDFRLNNDSIGTVTINGAYTKATGLLPFQLSAPRIKISGDIGFNEGDKPIHGTITADHQSLSFLAPYLTGYVSDLQGLISGKLTLSGTSSQPVATGSLQWDSLSLKVDYLATHYRLGSTTVQLSDNTISLPSLELRDDYDNRAQLSGKITHQHFGKLNFDFNINTNKFQFLNTTYFDNKQYYGTVYAGGKIHFYGPLNNMQMVVNVSPAAGTHVYLPISDNKDLGKHDFIIFKTYGEEMKAQEKKRQDVDLTLKLFADMNTNARVDVILDANTGDAISATGNGTINLNVSLNGNMTMYGNYTIEEGVYTFTFQRLIPKKFQIDPGSAITWNGSPYGAVVNVTAVYHVPNGASLYDLLAAEAAGNPLFGQDLQRRQPADVDLKLTGQLKRPDINFSINMPEEAVGGSYAMTRLQQITQDPNQLLNQVIGLLLFGQFQPETNTAGSPNLLRSGGLSSVGAILSSQGTTQLNNLISRLTKNNSFGVNFNYSPYSATAEEGDPMQRNALSVGLTKSFLNNRIRVEVGSQWDWGRSSGQYTYTSYFDPIGDFQLEYFLTPDGRIRLAAFRRSNYNVLLENDRTIYGGSISYKRQFDYFRENFESIRRQRHRQDSLLKINSINKNMQDSTLSNPPADTDSLYSQPKVKATIK